MTYFDSLGFAQALEEVEFPPEQAEALAGLIRDHVVGNTTRKEDLSNTESRIGERIDRIEERVRSELKQLEQRMTIKLGSMLVVAVGIIVAAQRLW